MKIVSKDEEKMVVELTVDEARTIVGVFNDALDGPQAYADLDWNQYIPQPRELAEALCEAFAVAVRSE